TATQTLRIGDSRALSCQFTPKAGLPSYVPVQGYVIEPISVELIARDDDGNVIPGSSTPSQSAEDETPALQQLGITELYLLDLKLNMVLHITKNGLPVTETLPALPGETIDIRIAYTNDGASPLGCAIMHPDCALRLESSNLPLPQELLAAYNNLLQL